MEETDGSVSLGTNPDNRLGSTPEAKPSGQRGAEDLNDDFYYLDFSVGKSRRYHEKLSRFYSGWSDGVRIFNAIAGSAAFLLIVADAEFGKLAVGLVALWAVIDIIVRPDKKAEIHAELGKNFTDLARQIAASPHTEEALRAFRAERLSIEASEPPCKRLVDLEARNDECRARGVSPDDLVPLSRRQRWLGRYFDFDMDRLEQWKAGRQRASA